MVQEEGSWDTGMQVWKGTPRTQVYRLLGDLKRSRPIVTQEDAASNLEWLRIEAEISGLFGVWNYHIGPFSCTNPVINNAIKHFTLEKTQDMMASTEARHNCITQRGFRKWHSFLPEPEPTEEDLIKIEVEQAKKTSAVVHIPRTASGLYLGQARSKAQQRGIFEDKEHVGPFLVLCPRLLLRFRQEREASVERSLERKEESVKSRNKIHRFRTWHSIIAEEVLIIFY